MTQQHPITPPPELVQQWCDEAIEYNEKHFFHQLSIATRAAQWGADQELEACCEWLRSKDILEPAIDALRTDRRPKPPSLKEQSIALLDLIQGSRKMWQLEDLNVIRQALEQLPDDK